MSPLIQGLNYRSACDVYVIKSIVQKVLVLVLPILSKSIVNNPARELLSRGNVIVTR